VLVPRGCIPLVMLHCNGFCMPEINGLRKRSARHGRAFAEALGMRARHLDLGRFIAWVLTLGGLTLRAAGKGPRVGAIGCLYVGARVR
jgi:hypothetical protein